jgi:MoaA/NifB/PqqE/SkfB family radical SAM enzyme
LLPVLKFIPVRYIFHRRSWMLGGMTARKAQNLAKVAFAYVTKSEKVNGLPPILKIDISPACGLQCPSCLHANPDGRNLPLLEAQTFGKHDRISVDDFARIIDQVKDRIFAVSLFYYGDPYSHPQVDQLCGIARAANLNVHLTTHFSYNFSDARIEKIVRSGVTHLTVAVDGATQETYGVSRVGGKLSLVLSNLQRVAKYRNGHKLKWPFIEVQHLHHSHHPEGEAERVRKIVTEFGIDQFTVRHGLHLTPSRELWNVVRYDIDQYDLNAQLKPRAVPRCVLPYFNMVIRYNGDVIPCCMYRQGRQHANVDGRAILGNLFQQPLADIWNNDRYRENRRLVSDPTVLAGSPQLKESFCYGCRKITDIAQKSARS